ncbi:MAG TPA: hypothetical protein VLT92_11385, partial [Burkholderiales bacterium]|nr:hypothetical protein [Burkholderiales bacterium]
RPVSAGRDRLLSGTSLRWFMVGVAENLACSQKIAGELSDLAVIVPAFKIRGLPAICAHALTAMEDMSSNHPFCFPITRRSIQSIYALRTKHPLMGLFASVIYLLISRSIRRHLQLDGSA